MKKKIEAVRPSAKPAQARGVRTLAIDIGGTGIKAIVLDERGEPVSARKRMPTPKKATPEAVIGVIRKLAKDSGGFDRVSAGFPGVVKDGLVYTAANLGKGWKGFELERELSAKLNAPTRAANDADVQGLASISGRGLELVVTLGTGFGSVLFANGVRIHMELAHHPFHKGKTYEEELGIKALEKKGRRKWNKLLLEAIADLKSAFNYDRLYLGGGNTKYINVRLPADVTIVSNEGGLLGGIKLWREKRRGAGAQGRTHGDSAAGTPTADASAPGKVAVPGGNGVAPASGKNGVAQPKSKPNAASGT